MSSTASFTVPEGADRTAAFVPGAAPPPRREAIERRRLLDQLNGVRADCVLVVAPAGFGKTTLLSQWAQNDSRDQAWITLDERHNDPVLLVGQIAAALDGDGTLDEEVLAPLNGPAPDVSRVVVPRFCEALGRRGRPVALILDDVHAITEPASLGCIGALAELFPDGSRLLLASRSEPEIGVGRLRANGRLDEIRTNAMAMTRGEAAEAFGAVGQDLPFDLLKRLVELTEGWPAALYLASIALDGDDGPAEVLEQFGGDVRVVADYLRSEVLARLNDEEQDFLVRASLFDRLTGDLCDAVLERTGSGETLRRLSRSNLLLSPVDSKDTEFRMHALLREMLRAELGRVGAVEVADLHRRAADWFHSRGDVDESIAQVVASGDAELAGERIWEVCPEYEARGRRATLRAWILSLPEERIATVPSLAMVVAVGALTDGDGPALRHWAGAAETALATSGDPDPQLIATAEVLMLSQETSGGLREAADRLNELHDGFPEHHVWRTLCRLMGGSLFYLLGDRDRARPLLEEGARIGAMSGPAVQTICLSQLCLIALDEGRSGDAEQLASEALSRISLFGVEDYAASAVPYAAAALVRAHRGNAQGAAQLLSMADELLDSNPILNDWFGSEARVTAARAHLALGDLGVARKRLQEANALRERVPEAVVLDEWIESVREALDSGSAATGRWPLTPAELRLLQLLPTHMTFPEIATQLIVSTNTVKTQARSIYRKLGVSSRSEAVACARMGGLLDQVEERSPRSG